jgi:hypothetical protein
MDVKGQRHPSTPANLFIPRETAPGTHCIGVRVGLRFDLDAVERKMSVASAENRILIPRSFNL